MRRWEQRRLRGRVRALLRTLDVRPPLNLDELCRDLGTLRGREIVLQPDPDMPISASYAMWLAGEDIDLIKFQERTSPLHRRHLVLHELGHIIAGHRSDTTDILAALMPDLDPELVSSVLRRHAYDTEQEREAEYIASTILRWAAELEVLPVQPLAVRRAGLALSDRRGWL